MKKKTILKTICVGAALILLFNSFGELDGFESESDFSHTPPHVNKMWIKKLENVGNANLRLKVSYFEDERLESKIPFNVGNIEYLYDDGTHGDEVSNDKIYTINYTDDLTKVVADLESAEDNLAGVRSIKEYIGHTYNEKEITEAIKFDEVAFAAGAEVEVSAELVDPADCQSGIKKEKSLFITDLSVVEDLARTYNTKFDIGNPNGCWTFGQMIKNIANEPTSQVSAKQMLKNWLQSYMNDEQINQGITVQTSTLVRARRDAYIHMIRPWILKCIYKEYLTSGNFNALLTPVLTPKAQTSVAFVFFNDYTLDANGQILSTNQKDYDVHNITEENWESYWDAIDETYILKYAPFKLMAISNRIDMRSNALYLKYSQNYAGGESRFVFTLINLHGAQGAEGLSPIIGMPPEHVNQSLISPFFTDWKGMNVILEYGNSSKNLCEEKTLAVEWLNLSDQTLYPSFPLPAISDPSYAAAHIKSQNFNAALQQITDKVTKKNADSRRSQNNFSAINQIRTNEKIFHDLITKTDNIGWESANWELREFRINPNSHSLSRVNVQAVPNFEHISRNAFNIYNLDLPNPNYVKEYPDGALTYALRDWAFYKTNGQPNISRMRQIIFQKHIVPHNADDVYTAPTAILNDERKSYYDIWRSNNDPTEESKINNLTTLMPGLNPNWDNIQIAKQIRHGLSIGTCQGCHGGDNKTNFTMIQPRGYGETAIYWNGLPDYIEAKMDNRFEQNRGTTKQPTATPGQYIDVPNYSVPSSAKSYIPVVSSFITGIAINGAVTANSTPSTLDDGDDNFDPDDDDRDLNPDINNYSNQGLPRGANQFWVNDPSNLSTSAFPSFLTNSTYKKSGKFGFNELDRRRTDLCSFVNSPCGISIKSILSDIIKQVKHQPNKM